MDLAYELHDLVFTLDRDAETLLKPYGLTYRRYVALVIIGEHPGLTGRDLAGGLSVTEAATSGIVKKLLTQGLIRNLADVGSGHVRRLDVTDTGRDLQETCARLLGSSFDDNVRRLGIDPADLAATVRAIHDEVRKPPTSPTPLPNEEP